ncbi:MAG: long-chain fatty acid--CoA ligase [Firmicutes bacterium]|nr:long-chain fatty acid--CoA ligase [Bacillota bacterium]
MMEYPLTLKNLLMRNRQLFGKKEVVSRNLTGDFRYTYKDFYHRVCRLANVLASLDIKQGDKVATLAWNTHRHLELYFAIPCYGAVLHTLNLRLSREHLAYIINHAEDKVIFVDEDLVPLLESVQDQISTVKHFIVLDDTRKIPETGLKPVSSYEQSVAKAPDHYDFPDIDEWSPAAMCYTSATTGNPKGVVYTHRGLFMHAMALTNVDSLGLSEKDILMPVVPMFHVNAWGTPFAAVWVGSTLVMPGKRLDPQSLCQLIEQEKVTASPGVPTIWMGIAQLLESGAQYQLKSLRALVSGGAPLPEALIKRLDKYNIPVMHAYGMTETTPLVLVSNPKSYMNSLSVEEKYRLGSRQGLLVPGLEMKVIGENGQEVPWDGKQIGELWLRGPWIAKEYYKEPETSRETFVDGWMRTGDIVNVDEEGYVLIVDRAKDLIKSGGEWISSVDLENTIMAHTAVVETAVIAIPHEKWQERPLACVVLKESEIGKVSKQDILDFLRERVAKWWIPDEIIFVNQIPKTSTGKFSKRIIREMYRNRELQEQ